MQAELLDRWQELAGWLDAWFEPEQAESNDFDPDEHEVFAALSVAWRGSEDKLAALESVSARFGRDRVRDVVRRLCRNNTAAYWAGLTAREGGSLDDLIRLLWEPLVAQGFDFTMDRDDSGLRIDCRRCPQEDLAGALEAAGYDHARGWLYEMVCSTDFHVTGSFDPPIHFSRTQTLMQGHPHCDHTYTLGAPRGLAG
jgi:hypothetical protein